MARDVNAPPENPEALANLIGGEAPAPSAPKPTSAKSKPAGKKPVVETQPPAVLPPGRMGDKCKEPGCKGVLTDLSRAHLGKTKTAKGRTLITLYCNKCSKVQAQADIPDVN